MTETEPHTRARWSLPLVGLVTSLVCLAAILGAYLILEKHDFKANPVSHGARALVAAGLAGFAVACLSWPRRDGPKETLERFSTWWGLAAGMLQSAVALFLAAVAILVAFHWGELTTRPAPLLARALVCTAAMGVALVVNVRQQMSDEFNWPAVRRKGRGRHLLVSGILHAGLFFGLWMAGISAVLEWELFHGSPVRVVFKFVFAVIFFGLFLGFCRWSEMEKRHKAGGGTPDHQG